MKLRNGLAVLGILAVGLILPALCQAAVKGICSVCHSMHNSEQGSPVAFTRDSSGQKIASTQPIVNLLKTDCIGCHSDPGAETIIDIGGSTVPIVLNLIGPTYPPDGSSTSALAGGNFHWLIIRGDAYGHNVYGIAGEDLRYSLTQAPGGVARSGECVNCHGTLSSAQSGCEGCHVAEHHAGSADVVAGRDSGWYRFLGSVMQRDDQLEPTPEGVVGIEAPDWEQLPLVDRHNTYQGSTGPYVSYLESGSISQKCVGCHGQFHNETTANSIWIRHPVDVAIPDSGDFVGLTTYNPLVPVARPNITSEDAAFANINRGSDLVSCISCHRPHGSPYPAMLRWAYRDWPGNDALTGLPALNGCAVCHTSKD